MAELKTGEILQRPGYGEEQNFRYRLAGLAQGNLRTGSGLVPVELPAIFIYGERRNIVWRATWREP